MVAAVVTRLAIAVVIHHLVQAIQATAVVLRQADQATAVALRQADQATVAVLRRRVHTAVLHRQVLHVLTAVLLALQVYAAVIRHHVLQVQAIPSERTQLQLLVIHLQSAHAMK